MSNIRLHCHLLLTFTLLVLANPASAAIFSTLSNDKGWIYQVENPPFPSSYSQGHNQNTFTGRSFRSDYNSFWQFDIQEFMSIDPSKLVINSVELFFENTTDAAFINLVEENSLSIFDVDNDEVNTGGDLSYRYMDLQSGNVYGTDVLDFYSTSELPYDTVPDLTIELNQVALNDILASATNYFQIGVYLEGPRDVSDGKNAMGLWSSSEGPVVTLNIDYDLEPSGPTKVNAPSMVTLLGMGITGLLFKTNCRRRKQKVSPL